MVQALALFAFILPVVAPLVDHHYAQRRPHHTHAFLGTVERDHQHPELVQPHSHGGDSQDALSLTSPDTGATVSLPASGDWNAQATHAPTLLFFALPAALFPLAANRAQRFAPQTLLPSDEPFLPPPEKPPPAHSTVV